MKSDLGPLTRQILNEIKELKSLEKEVKEKQDKLNEFVMSRGRMYNEGFKDANHLQVYLFNRLKDKL